MVSKYPKASTSLLKRSLKPFCYCKKPWEKCFAMFAFKSLGKVIT